MNLNSQLNFFFTFSHLRTLAAITLPSLRHEKEQEEER